MVREDVLNIPNLPTNIMFCEEGRVAQISEKFLWIVDKGLSHPTKIRVNTKPKFSQIQADLRDPKASSKERSKLGQNTR